MYLTPLWKFILAQCAANTLEGMCKCLHQHVCVCASFYLCTSEGLAELLAWGRNCCPGKSRNKASEAISPVWVQMLFAAVVSSSIKKQKEEGKEEEWTCKQRWEKKG